MKRWKAFYPCLPKPCAWRFGRRSCKRIAKRRSGRRCWGTSCSTNLWWERSFLRNCLVICEFISQSYSFPLRSLSVSLFWNFKGIYGSPRKAVVKREIYSDKNRKEAFWETALCSVNTSPRIRAFPSRSRSLRLFLWNMQRDIWKPIEGYGEKGNIFRSKLERSFLRNCFVLCELISQS